MNPAAIIEILRSTLDTTDKLATALADVENALGTTKGGATRSPGTLSRWIRLDRRANRDRQVQADPNG